MYDSMVCVYESPTLNYS